MFVSLTLHLFNVLSILLPVREILGVRQRLLRAAGLKLGHNVRLTRGVQIFGPKVTIGDRTWVGLNSHLYSTPTAGILIGSDVDIGPDTRFFAGTHKIGGPLRRAGEGSGLDIIVGAGSWIGGGSIVLPGVILGKSCVVGAGSVVRAGVYESNALIAGNPAVVKRTLDE